MSLSAAMPTMKAVSGWFRRTFYAPWRISMALAWIISLDVPTIRKPTDRSYRSTPACSTSAGRSEFALRKSSLYSEFDARLAIARGGKFHLVHPSQKTYFREGKVCLFLCEKSWYNSRKAAMIQILCPPARRLGRQPPEMTIYHGRSHGIINSDRERVYDRGAYRLAFLPTALLITE